MMANGLMDPTDLRCVVSEPVISLSEVIKDDATAVTTASGEHNGGGGVSLAGHPGGVESVCDEEERHDQNHPTRHLRTNQSRASLSEPMTQAKLRKVKRKIDRTSFLIG